MAAVTARKTGGLTFSLERRVAFLDFFARFFRRNEAKTGDASFDSNWVLKTNRPEFMQAALLPEMRAKIIQFTGDGVSRPNFKLEGFRVVYSESGSFSSDKVCDRIAQAADIVCDLVDAVARAIKTVAGIDTELSTTGGTSDGRFIADICPQVVEFGPTNATIHKLNECIPLDDLEILPKMYEQVRAKAQS